MTERFEAISTAKLIEFARETRIEEGSDRRGIVAPVPGGIDFLHALIQELAARLERDHAQLPKLRSMPEKQGAMIVSLSKSQIRELIRSVEGTDIDTDVVHVLESFLIDPANVRKRSISRKDF